MGDEPSVALAVVTALVLVGALVLERLLLTRWRFDAYFKAGLPLLPPPVPIPEPPTGEGRTATVRWEVVGDLVRFWGVPGERTAPTGLHGAIRLYRSGRRVGLAVRWSPPLAYLLAACWLVVLGAVRDALAVALPIALVLIVGIYVTYRGFAVRAVREMRFAFLERGGPGASGS